MPFKAKDLTVKIKFPAIQVVTMTDSVNTPEAADIGGTVTYDTGAVAIGKLLGFEEAEKDIWYIETTTSIAAGKELKVRGSSAAGTSDAAGVESTMMYLVLKADGYVDCDPTDIGDIVSISGAPAVKLGPLVEYDNVSRIWLVALADPDTTCAENKDLEGLGTGDGTTEEAGTTEISLGTVEGMSIELLYEGGMEYLFGREKEVGVGPKHATFTVRRWFYADTDKDLLFDLFNTKASFDLEGEISGQVGSTIRIRKCKALRWRPVLGTANDTIAEEIVGEAEDWVKSTPTD